MATVTQHLWFEKGMREALATYVDLIPGSRIDWMTSRWTRSTSPALNVQQRADPRPAAA